MTVLRTPLTVFDLEYTAWECSMAGSWLKPGEFKEVVQIGAVKLDSADFAVLDEFEVLVRPRINGTLSAYFEKLTGITSGMLARKGMDFEQAHKRFLAFVGDGPVWSFGRDDQVLEDNIRLYGLKTAKLLTGFHDLRPWFTEQGLDPRGLDSCDLGRMLGLPFLGRRHNALDDCRTLAGAMTKMAM